MKKIISILIVFYLVSLPICAVTLPQDTMVMIAPQKKIIADDVKISQQVKFQVIMPVKVANKTIIKTGTEVQGQIINKKNNMVLGIPGKLEIGNFRIIQPNGDVIHLRGNIIDEGEARYWAHVGWFFLFPLLLVKGDDGQIPANIQYIVYTIEDIDL